LASDRQMSPDTRRPRVSGQLCLGDQPRHRAHETRESKRESAGLLAMLELARSSAPEGLASY